MRTAVLAALLVTAVAGCGGGGSSAPPSPPAAPASHAAARPAAPRPPALCGALRVRVTGRVADPSANELSGLVRSRSQPDLLWSHDDSGAGPLLYGLRSDGRVATRPTVTGAQAEDWEDIAAGPGADGRPLLYVGDIGDNGAQRPAIDVYRVAEPRVGDAATAPAAHLRLRYPDGAHDAEALLVDPLRGELVIVTKVLGAGAPIVPPPGWPRGRRRRCARGLRSTCRSSPPAT